MSRVLGSIQAGVVLLLLGIALLSLQAGPYAPWIRQILLLSGVAIAAIGVGLLISAWITMRLCRKWGLLKDGRDLSYLAQWTKKPFVRCTRELPRGSADICATFWEVPPCRTTYSRNLTSGC